MPPIFYGANMTVKSFLLPFRPAISATALEVVPGARLHFYLTGTTTEAAVYADEALTIELPNPVVANAAGKWPAIFYDDSTVYRVILRDEAGVTMDEADPYTPAILDTVNAALQGLVNSAGAQAALAQTAAQAAAADADTAQIAAGIVNAAGAGYNFYSTKADAVAAAPSLPNGYAHVWKDESQSNHFTVYSVTSGALSASPVADLTPAPISVGTIATQNANNVNITGGKATGLEVAPYADTATNLAAKASAGTLVPRGLYNDTTNNRVKMATSATTLIDVGPPPPSSADFTYDYLAANFTGTSTTLTDTGLDMAGSALAANALYEFELLALTKVASGYYRIGITALTGVEGSYYISAVGTGGSLFDSNSFGGVCEFLTAYQPSNNMRNSDWARIAARGVIATGAPPGGTLKLQIRNASGSATHTVMKGSFIKWRKLN